MEIILGLATILGGIAAIWYFTEKITEKRINNPVQAVPESGTPSNELNADTQSPPSTDSEQHSAGSEQKTPLHAPEHSLPIETVLQVFATNNNTALQKSQFAKRHTDRHVTWWVMVKSIKTAHGPDPNSDIIMVASAIEDKKSFPSLAALVFPSTEGGVLGGLNPGIILLFKEIFHSAIFVWVTTPFP